jgi:alcohol dehydrogenase class IV
MPDSERLSLQHGLEHSVSGLYNNVTMPTASAPSSCPLWSFPTIGSERFALVAKAFGKDITGIPIEKAAEMSIECVRDFIEKMGMTTTLGKLGVKESDVGWLAQNAQKVMPANLINNPRTPTAEEIMAIYESCI